MKSFSIEVHVTLSFDLPSSDARISYRKERHFDVIFTVEGCRISMWSLKNWVSGQVPASAVSTALVICSGAWLYSAFAGYRASGLGQNWSLTPLFCLLALTLTPAICCSLALIIIDSRKRWRLSCLDRSALVAAILPVTLGTFLAVGATKALVFAHP